jgi:Contractile injection system tube protein
MSNISIDGPSQKLERAYITIVQPTLINTVGGVLGSIGAASSVSSGATAVTGQIADKVSMLGQTINFKFNPQQYSVSKDGNWKDHASMAAVAAGPRQWLGTNPKTLSLELLLDESDNPGTSVTKDAELLFSCCSVSMESLLTSFIGQAPSAPFVLFGWGSSEPMVATVSSVNVTYTMFHPDGTPYRAKVNISLKEYGTKTPGQNPTSGSTTRTRTCVVTAGDSLPLIAYREYRRPGYWRAIAEVNDIEDPLRIPIGTTLLLPDPIEAAARSGVDSEGRSLNGTGGNGHGERPGVPIARELLNGGQAVTNGYANGNGNGNGRNGKGRRKRNGPLMEEGIGR